MLKSSSSNTNNQYSDQFVIITVPCTLDIISVSFTSIHLKCFLFFKGLGLQDANFQKCVFVVVYV